MLEAGCVVCQFQYCQIFLVEFSCISVEIFVIRHRWSASVTDWSVLSIYMLIPHWPYKDSSTLCQHREMDLYVWAWKVNSAAPCSVTGISYKADNCCFLWKRSTQRTCRDLIILSWQGQRWWGVQRQSRFVESILDPGGESQCIQQLPLRLRNQPLNRYLPQKELLCCGGVWSRWTTMKAKKNLLVKSLPG